MLLPRIEQVENVSKLLINIPGDISRKNDFIVSRISHRPQCTPTFLYFFAYSDLTEPLICLLLIEYVTLMLIFEQTMELVLKK